MIATASSAGKRAKTLELGADAAVDPAAEDLTAALIEANGGRPVDVVLEMSGGRVFDAAIEASRRSGGWPTGSPAASRTSSRRAG